MATASNDSAVTLLTTVATEQQAALIVAALEDNDLAAHYAGDATASFRLGIPGAVQINVHTEDLPKAQQLLTELQVPDSRVGDESAPVRLSAWRTVCKALVVLGLIVLAMTYVWHILG